MRLASADRRNEGRCPPASKPEATARVETTGFERKGFVHRRCRAHGHDAARTARLDDCAIGHAEDEANHRRKAPR